MVGFRLKEQKGPRHSPRPWSQRAGHLTWEPSRLPGFELEGQTPSSPLLLLWSWRALPACLSCCCRPPSYAPRTNVGWGLGGQGTGQGAQQAPQAKWAGQSPSAPLQLLPEGPSHLPLLISWASLLCPQDPSGLEGALEGGYRPGSSAGSPARVGQEIALCSSPALPGGSLPPASPDLPGLRAADPVWPPLLLLPQSPHVLPVHLRVPPVSLGISVPDQWPAGALAAGRR